MASPIVPSRVSTATGITNSSALRIGKSAQQYRVHGAKDGAIGTDAKREYEHRDGGDPRLCLSVRRAKRKSWVKPIGDLP